MVSFGMPTCCALISNCRTSSSKCSRNNCGEGCVAVARICGINTNSELAAATKVLLDPENVCSPGHKRSSWRGGKPASAGYPALPKSLFGEAMEKLPCIIHVLPRTQVEGRENRPPSARPGRRSVRTASTFLRSFPARSRYNLRDKAKAWAHWAGVAAQSRAAANAPDREYAL